MKKLLLSFISALLFSVSTMSNPVYFPAVFFSELYWEEGEWNIELIVSQGYFESGSQIKMKCSSGESMLLENIHFPDNGIMLITSDSLQQPITLNREGDFIEFLFEEYTGNWTSDFGKHRFGNYPGAEVSALMPGQSMVQYYNIDYNQHYLTKTNNITPGAYPNDVSSYGALEGYVFDEEGNPVDVAIISEFRFLMYTFDLTTDVNGAFSTIDVMPGNYYVLTYKDDCIVHDTMLITVEPDSTAYTEIVADTCIILQAEKEIAVPENEVELQVYPNPFHASLTVNIKSRLPLKLKDGMVKIFSQDGKQMLMKRINSPYLTDLTINLDAEMNEFHAGVYFLTIENAGEVLKSQKIIHE